MSSLGPDVPGRTGGTGMLSSAGREGNVSSQRPTGTASTYVITDTVDEVAVASGQALGRVLAELPCLRSCLG